MKILITGANGLLGSNLVRKLLQTNFPVKLFVRPSSKLSSLEGVDAEIFKGDLLNPNDLKQALEGCSVVIHAAANTSQWPNQYENYHPINVEATRLLLEESASAGIERFIFVSSANAFGPGSKMHPGTENSSFTSLQHQSGYMLSKYRAQELVLQFHREHHFPAVVVNPTFMLGKYDAKPSSGQLLLMAHGKSWMPCPAGGKNFIHVEDAADGIIHAINQGRTGSSYLLANENLTYKEFFLKMKLVCGTPKNLIPMPKEITNLAGEFGSIYEKLSHKAPKLNHINSQLLTADNYYSGEKAVNELQLPQTPVETAIKNALSWFGEHGYLN